jgi:hypothetical protein
MANSSIVKLRVREVPSEDRSRTEGTLGEVENKAKGLITIP